MPHEKYPVQPRWMRADDAYLSPAYGADSVGISIGGDTSTDYLTFFHRVDEALEDLGARMHCGKVHFLTRDRIAALYPKFEDFQGVRRELDPDGLFLKEFTQQLFG
jgi:FAD/FMN-containing dehydrogenase